MYDKNSFVNITSIIYLSNTKISKTIFVSLKQLEIDLRKNLSANKTFSNFLLFG